MSHESSAALANAGFDVFMLATPNIDYYADETRKNWSDYCMRHGYEFTCYREQVIDDMHIIWSKIALLQDHLKKTTAEWVFMVDADTLVNRPDLTLQWLVDRYPRDKDVLISEDCSRRFGLPVPLSLNAVIKSRSYRAANCGFIAFRNTEFSRELADKWLRYGRTKLAHLADVFPREQAVFWVGLLREHRDRIDVLGREVMRVGINEALDKWTINAKNAFVLHDKRLTNFESA